MRPAHAGGPGRAIGLQWLIKARPLGIGINLAGCFTKSCRVRRTPDIPFHFGRFRPIRRRKPASLVGCTFSFFQLRRKARTVEIASADPMQRRPIRRTILTAEKDLFVRSSPSSTLRGGWRRRLRLKPYILDEYRPGNGSFRREISPLPGIRRRFFSIRRAPPGWEPTPWR